jgi:hypothetical protein
MAHEMGIESSLKIEGRKSEVRNHRPDHFADQKVEMEK